MHWDGLTDDHVTCPVTCFQQQSIVRVNPSGWCLALPTSYPSTSLLQIL